VTLLLFLYSLYLILQGLVFSLDARALFYKDFITNDAVVICIVML
jgi:hypothetical protein